jgi:hypothetical protein
MRRRLTGLAVLAALALPAPAQAAPDLYLLDGDPPLTLSGTATYGPVYIDSGVVLAGDGVLVASSVYIGPNAYVDGCPDNLCGDGRSLEIRATGAVELANGVDLEGSSGDGHAAGSLTLRGSRVSVGGGVDTAGHAAASGDLTIVARADAVVGDVYAPNGSVTISGATITTGEIFVQPGYQSNANGAGDVSLLATGDVRSGAIDAAGGDGDATTAPGRGGHVRLDGRRVNAGSIAVNGGRGTTVPAGTTGLLRIRATGSVGIGDVGMDGPDGDGTAGAAGGSLDLRAGGDVRVGNVYGRGGSALHAGGTGAAVVLYGRTIDTGDLWLQGGNGGADATSTIGGAGGATDIRGSGVVTTGRLAAYGGNAGDGAGMGGLGGRLTVHGAAVHTGEVLTAGGGGSTGPGVAGAAAGTVTLRGGHGLVVAGGIDARGADARSSDDPAPAGGTGGAIVLDAGSGDLVVSGVIRNGGGGGADGAAAKAGTGGRAGAVDLLGARIGPIAGLFATGGGGGFYGDRGGAGGAGGAVRSWSASDPFDATRYLSTAGGDGAPTGTDGLKQRNQPPGRPALRNGRVRFTSNSPGATGYRVYLAYPHARPRLVATTTVSSYIRVGRIDPCRTAVITVVAVQRVLGWLSTPSPALRVRPQPGACA